MLKVLGKGTFGKVTYISWFRCMYCSYGSLGCSGTVYLVYPTGDAR